jgi:hypothetical protein
MLSRPAMLLVRKLVEKTSFHLPSFCGTDRQKHKRPKAAKKSGDKNNGDFLLCLARINLAEAWQ